MPAVKKKKIINSLVLSKSKKAVLDFREIPVNEQGFILLDVPARTRKKIINQLEIEEIIKFIRYLDPDKAAELLRSVKKTGKRKKIIEKLNRDIKDKVEFLLKFEPRTAAGLMNLHYIEIDKNLKIRDVFKIVRDCEKKTKKFPEILVVDKGFLVGELEGNSLFLHGAEKIENHIKKVPFIKYNKSEKEVINLFKENPHKQIVVLDEDKSILGVIYSDDILKLMKRKSAGDIFSFTGVKEEENVYDPAFVKVKNRYKWLLINLCTAFLAAFVVSLFEKTISGFVLLAVYMPIVAGMGGNAGAQTLAVIVRGLALREIEFKSVRKIIFNEVTAGAVNGTINGTIVAAIAFLFNKNPLFGLIVGVAMVLNLIIAAFFGTIIPLIMKWLKKDPASSATIFITTATDVFGFFVFLGLATILL